MAVYAIFEMKVQDTKAHQANAQTSRDLVTKYGGEFLAARGACEVLEGEWSPSQLTIIRFADRATLQQLLDDPAHNEWHAKRSQFAQSNLVIVEGTD